MQYGQLVTMVIDKKLTSNNDNNELGFKLPLCPNFVISVVGDLSVTKFPTSCEQKRSEICL